MSETAPRKREPQGEASKRRALVLCGLRTLPDRTGALYIPELDTLVVSDLHFEKATSFATRGIHLPPYDTRSTLAGLEDAMGRYAPGRVIALGDSFHDRAARERLADEDRDRIRALCAAAAWTWIVGNHDPEPPRDLGGTVTACIEIGPLLFRHEPRPAPATGEVAGHLHPAAAVVARGRRLRRRCFATDGTRLVMPSFGAMTGGLCVRSQAFGKLFAGTDFTAWLIGRDEVYPVAGRRVHADRS